MDTDDRPAKHSAEGNSQASQQWHWEDVIPGWRQGFSVQSIVYSGRTPYQKVEVIDTDLFGRCLILDDKVQSTTADEFIYHEALVHPALLAHPQPQNVLIAGGGEGASLREVLRHRSVTHVTMLDIDREVVDLCRRFLPGMSQGAFDDPRAELVVTDAWEHLEKRREKYDVVILDLTDPMPDGPSQRLNSREFYQLIKRRLSPEGVVVTQAGSTAWRELARFCATYNTMRKVYTFASGYQVSVPCFGIVWGFVVASPALKPLQPEEVDRQLAERLSSQLRFYDGIAHQGIFSLPKFLRDTMRRTTRTITLEQPLLTPV
ncbi:MAG: polyamine aminopropyltransferase [Chloroflexi bacterium]|nr:polyamine aminopropyltransferase [Chloroflexota bacterium]